jgi:serine/threonine protein kinase
MKLVSVKASEAAQPDTPLSPGSRDASSQGQAPLVPDYQLISRIGIGAYGEVWLARGTLGTFRAVKVVTRSSFEHNQPFEREFKGIQRFEPISLTHESQVKILHVGRNEAAGYFYYVMELADDAASKEEKKDVGGAGKVLSIAFADSSSATYLPRTLKHEVQTRGRLPVEECVQIGLALATALAHLHEHGLIHRDVKPSNIIFVSGVPKLADIGLVTDIEATRSFVGTEGFIPPEGPGTVSADIYSLGKVLYEISVGRSRLDFPALPANWDDIPEAARARLLEFNEVLVKACESDASRRYVSARQMYDELLLLQQGESVKDKRARERNWVVAKRLGLVGTTAALLIAGGIFLKGFKPGHTPNPEAARLYELGRWYYNQLTPEDHANALESLTQAVEKDPKFTRPYGELMMLYTWNSLPGITNEQIRLEKVQEIADKALRIDPNAAEGQMALSWCRFLQRDWRGAETQIQMAIKRDPNLTLAHDVYCFYLSMEGRAEEAHREGRLSAELSPVYQRASALIAAWPFMAERRFDLAIAQLKRVLKLDPKFDDGHSFLADCYEASSNYVAAIEEYRTADLLTGKDPAKVTALYATLRQAHDAGGREGYLRKRIDLLLTDRILPANERVLQDSSDRDIAGYYAQLGEKDKALDLLERHFDEPQVWHQIKFLWWFDPLHDEPRFKELVKRARLEL